MSESPPDNARARLQSLLAIPERQRTDAEWDEINELEIMLVAGNRPGAPPPRMHGNAPAGNIRPRPGGESRRDRNQQKKFHHKRSRRHPPGR